MRKVFVLAIALILPISSFAQIWVARYNGPGNDWDEAKAMAVDEAGNIYVTGESVGSGTSLDYATVKYNSSGDSLWVARYNGPGNSYDYASAIAIDDSSNVYVTGYSYGSGTDFDYATVKYDSSGAEQWVKRYDGPISGEDKALAIAVDDSGNVYVTGYSWGSGTHYDYATVKYNSSGAEQWVKRYNGPINSEDKAYAIAVDGSGNVYVAGYSVGSSSGEDYLTIKYNSSGDSLWVAKCSDGNKSYAIAVDGSGNVYVTGYGYSPSTMYDYATAKYNSSGTAQWAERYNGPGGRGEDKAHAIAVDGAGNVYVTGWSERSGTDFDYATVKYSSSGVEQWVERYNGSNGDDYAQAITVDGSGYIYVTGYSEGSSSGEDYLTIKYNSSGDSLWVRRYDGPGNNSDRATAIAVDNAGYVYVTGGSYGSGTGYDYATIKYSCAGVEESELRVGSLELRVFPNPSTTIVKVQWLGVNERQKISLKVYDLGGRLAKHLLNNEVISGNKIDVRLDELAKGIYFVKMGVGNFTATKKMILMR